MGDKMSDTQALTRPTSTWTSFANTTTFFTSSGVPPLTESAPGPPPIPIPISLSSFPTSSITTITRSDTSTSQLTSNLPLSASPETSPSIPHPTPADVSSQASSPTWFNTNIPPTPDPTSPSTPAPAGGERTPPILMIIAIVISIFIFILLVTLLALRQLALRKRQRGAQPLGDTELPLPGSSSHSTASTYHSAHRGEVRVVIERPPGGWGRERPWPVLPGHPSYYYYAQEPAMAVEEESGTVDANHWSITSQDGSNSLPETGTSLGRGRVNTRAAVGRAY